MKRPQTVFESRSYQTSRKAYTLQCLFEYFISILSADAFLAKLLKYIGLSDALTGLLSSVISFSFLFKLLSVPLAGRPGSIKKPVIALDTVSQLLFAAMYLVPFLPFGVNGKAAAVTVLMVSAYFTLYLNTSVAYKWGNSFVSPDKRGDFSATKEMISLMGGVFFTLTMGFVTDRFEADGRLTGAFVFIAAVMGAVCAANFVSFMKISDITLSESGTDQSAKAIIGKTFGNRRCLNAMILTSASEFAKYVTIGFLGTYKTVDLGFSVGTIQIMNVVGNLARFAVSKPFGRYSDRHSYSDGYFLGTVLQTAAFVTGAFTSVKTRWLTFPYAVLFAMSQAGTSQNNFNMMYSFTDGEYILPAMAVNDSMRGVFGFAGSLVGSAVLSAVSRSKHKTAAAQQILCGISALLSGGTLVFNKLVVSAQKEDRK